MKSSKVAQPRGGVGIAQVAHVESGHCTGCLGVDNARQQFYQYHQANTLAIGDRAPMLHLDEHGRTVVPDKPYACSCGKAFRQLSSQLNHQSATGHA